MAAIPLFAAGCGGISASKTISPLDFLLPGILRADPPQTNAPVVLSKNSFASFEVACAR
jgi:hypothetical protein